jgi:UDP-glucose 4-epimerase
MYPRDYNHVNVGGTVSLMEAMRDAGIRRVVLTSSGAVYGDQDEQPLHEALPLNPGSPYAVSKIAAEIYVRTIGAQWGIETVSLRIFNAYGPDQQLPVSHAPVIPRFLKSALTGASLVIFGTGEQTRDFVYIDDVVAALTAAASAPGVDQQVINVGSGQETSLNELVRTIDHLVDEDLALIRNTGQQGGVARMCADLTRARTLLGFSPETTLEAGLKRTLTLDPRFAV